LPPPPSIQPAMEEGCVEAKQRAYVWYHSMN